jgi:hypothetical protein
LRSWLCFAVAYQKGFVHTPSAVLPQGHAKLIFRHAGLWCEELPLQLGKRYIQKVYQECLYRLLAVSYEEKLYEQSVQKFVEKVMVS